ncbi:MAG: PLDc N-terminal domain-containing protein [Desulfobacteraceae bacterium]|jgi:hypothetical protein
MDPVTFFVIVGATFFLLTCMILIDVARKDFGGIEKKALWGFIAMIPFIGPIIYLLIGFRKGRPVNTKP